MSGKVTYHQQVSYCGKPRCRKCREGIGHGPYWYAYTTENGRTTRTYIGKNLPSELQEAQDSSSIQLEPVALRIRTLGQFQLERRSSQDWQPVEDAAWQHQRVRALLAHLVSSPGRKLGREQLMDVLWPDADIEAASSRLDRTVYTLRQLIEPAHSRPASSRILRMERERLVLADQSQIWVDADEFESLLDRARASNDPGGSEKLLEEAMALYGGDYLPEDLSSDLIIARHESLQRSWMGLLLELADVRIDREAFITAIDPLDRLLAIDPANEAAVQRLIISLAQLDRRAEALRAYHRFASVLQRDYNIAPLPETRSLYEAVQQGDSEVVLTLPIKPLSSPEIASPGDRETPIASRHSFKVQIGRSHQTPLIGRAQELETMNQLLLANEQGTRAHLTNRKKASSLPLDTQRRPQCILLVGEAGIGKTRLAEELSQGAQKRGWAVAWSRVYAQESSVPYRQWTEVLRSAMANGLWQRQEISAHPLVYQPLSTLLPELHDLFPHVVFPSPLPPEQEQLRLWEATLELLNTISERTPLLLVLDDFHWADASSSELFAYLVRRLHGRPIVMVGTYRDNELPTSNPLRSLLTDLQREQVIMSIPIQPLTDEQIASLVAHVPGTMVQYIQTRAAGNPFFAEELARTVETQITPAASNAESAQDTHTLAHTQVNISKKLDTEFILPDTIAAVLELRMNRLSAACQRLLGNAAVLGGSFTFHVIQHMETGVHAGTSEDTILDLLEEAIQAGVLTEEGTGTRINYQFWHPLLVSHLYEQLSAARRARLHRRAAEVLQRVYQGREEEEGAAIITNHLFAGGAEPLQIVHYAELAGDHAYNLSAYPEAEGFYRIAATQLDEHIGPSLANATWDERSRLAYILERLGECTRVQGNYGEARHLYERVLEVRSHQRTFVSQEEHLYEAQIDALLWREIALTWYDVGDGPQAQRCCERGEQILGDAGVVGGAAWAILRFQEGYNNWHEGNYHVAWSKAQDALKLFEEALKQQQSSPIIVIHQTGTKRTLAGDPVNLGRIQTLIGAIANLVGEHTEALKYLKSALNVFEQYNCKREIANVCCNLGDVYLRKAEHEQARAAFSRSNYLAEMIGDVPLMSAVFGNLGVLATRSGNLSEAEEWFKRGIKLAEQIKDQTYLCVLHIYLAIVLQDQGKRSQSIKSILYALSISRSTKNTPYVGFALVVIGSMHSKQAMTLIDSKENVNHENKKYKIGEKEQDLKDHRYRLFKRAQHLLKRALALEGLESETKIEGQLVLAQVSLLQGDLDEAWQQVTDTLEEAHRYELIWEPARAQSLLGSILAAQGHIQQAEQYFENAMQVFHKCGMRLEYARTLHSYGVSLLEHAGIKQKNYQQGLRFLREARQIFHECAAALDLDWIEHEIAFREGS